MADKIIEDTEISKLIVKLKQKNEDLKEETKDFTDIKTIIDKLKNKYIEKIITFNIGYEKKDLEKNSITKLQEIYTNYKEENENNNDKCYKILTHINNIDKNKTSFIILFAALFNKRNYILNKLFNEQYFRQSNTPDINTISIKLSKSILNISNNTEQNFVNVITDTVDFCNLLLRENNTTYETNFYYFKYLNKIKIYLENTSETNFYYFIYLIQDKLIEFPKNICDTNSNKYNNKLFYNISYDEKELNIKDLNTDNKLKLNVLLENGNTDEVIIKKIPLIFININKKYKAANPIKTFLQTIYKIYEDFIKLFEDKQDVIKANIRDDDIKKFINSIILCLNHFNLIYKYYPNNDYNNRYVDDKDVYYKENYTNATEYIKKTDIYLNNSSPFLKFKYDLAKYYTKLLTNMNLLVKNIIKKNTLDILLTNKLILSNNNNLFDTAIILLLITYTNEIYRKIIADDITYNDNLFIFIDKLKEGIEEFKQYIDNVKKIIDDDISDGLNSFNQFTDEELSVLELDIKPEKVSFGQTLEIGDNVLYLNSIVIKHKKGINYTDYIYTYIYECSGKWYHFNINSKPNFKALGNFAEMYKWIGPIGSAQTVEYVQKNVVGLFYT